MFSKPPNWVTIVYNATRVDNFHVCLLTQGGRFAPRPTDPPLFLLSEETADGGLDALFLAGLVEGILASSGGTVGRKTEQTDEEKKKKINSGGRERTNRS